LSVGIADGVLLALGLAAGPRFLAAHAASLAASVLALAPFAAAERAGGGPALTTTTFSWLHVLALAGFAAFAGALAVAARARAPPRSARSPWRRSRPSPRFAPRSHPRRRSSRARTAGAARTSSSARSSAGSRAVPSRGDARRRHSTAASPG